MGCIYVLVSSEENLRNITGRIEREAGEDILEVENIEAFTEVLAYDLEEDGTVGMLFVSALITLTEKQLSI